MTTCAFPTELICDILSYTSPVDVVRWRTVSKQFHTITHEPALWKALYANTHYLHPPGPFPTVSFEHAFVRSARLAQLWTTRHLRTVSHTSIPFDGCVLRNVDLVDGRWLVVCQMRRRFVLYDTRANSGAEMQVPRVLWEQSEEIDYWIKYVATSEQGQCIIYVLLSIEDLRLWRLLEFRLDAESGALCDTVSLDVPLRVYFCLGIYDRLTSARSPFLAFLTQNMVFDMRTRIFYEVPNHCIALDMTRSWPINAEGGDVIDVVPTKTHVILFRDFSSKRAPSCIVIQAFTVPDDQHPVEDSKARLRLTHEGIFSGRESEFAVIRDSVLDPVTGAINVKLIRRHWSHWDDLATCIDLTLEKPSQDAVSPITINRHDVLMLGDELTDCRTSFIKHYHIDISDDGYARGLFMWYNSYARSSDVVKFTIDATQDRCVVVLRRFSAAEWPLTLPILHSSDTGMRQHAVLDGVRGRLFYVDKDSDRRAVVVVDIE